MQYTITRTCGHVETFQLYGSAKERDRRAAWLERRVCGACARAAEAAKAAKAAEAAGLPPLVGSPDQVAWAMRLRAELQTTIMTQLDTALATGVPAVEIDKGRAAFVKALAAHTEAAWWIDHRANLRRELEAAYLAALAAL